MLTHRPDDTGSVTSETSVNSHQSTRCDSPEDGHLSTHRHENLKSYLTSYRSLLDFKNLSVNLLHIFNITSNELSLTTQSRRTRTAPLLIKICIKFETRLLLRKFCMSVKRRTLIKRTIMTVLTVVIFSHHIIWLGE
jgi:hypothetical protein